MTTESQHRIYLAGPDVFYPEPAKVAAEKKALLAGFDLRGVFPLDHEVDRDHTPAQMASAIFKMNCELIDSCQAVIANITPFRGPSLDVGSPWEIGYARGHGKPVVAYTDDPALYREKVFRGGWLEDLPDARDRDGNEVEDFGIVDNLMITESVIAICPSFEKAARLLKDFFDR